jgi:hypothetical protein
VLKIQSQYAERQERQGYDHDTQALHQ